MPENHTKLLFRDAFLSTVFVFACIAIFALNPLNIKVFNLMGSSLKDIEFTDIVFSGKNPNNGEIQAKVSNDIILVNAADRGRKEIAILLNRINEEKPAVVGVDFIFEGPKDSKDDSMLKAAFSNTAKLVLASKFKNNDYKGKPKYITTSKTLGEYKEGYVNLMVTSLEKSVRYFRASDQNESGTVHPFAFEIVKSFDSTKVNSYLDNHNDFELINYEGNLNAFHQFNGNDILAGNYPEGFLTGKIILIGFFGSDCNPNPILDDNFYTPMNEKIMGRKFPDTYGVVIHANIVNMILRENYIHKTSAGADWALGFLICFLHNLIFIRHFVHKHLWYHFFAKLIQLVSTFVIIYFFIYLFREYHIKLDATPFIVPVLLTVDMLYFYDAIVQWMHKKFKTKSYFLTGPVHH